MPGQVGDMEFCDGSRKTGRMFELCKYKRPFQMLRGASLVITQTFARNVRFGFQPAKAGGSIKPGVERPSAEPWEYWLFRLER